MTKTTKRNLWILAAVFLIGGLIAAALYKNSKKKEGTAVEFGEVAQTTIEERVSASGRIFPVTDVAISSDVSGEVVQLFVKEGDSVRAGQLMARIDADAYESQVARGQAAVDAARAGVSTNRSSVQQAIAERKRLEAQLATAELALKRAQQLSKEGLISTADLETAQVNVNSTRASIEAAAAGINAAEENVRGGGYQVASARASLRELQTSLRRTNITAPMSGIVSQLNVEEGERVVGTMQMAGTELARVADLNRMEVRVEVSENDIPRVDIGDVVEIEVDAYLDRKFTGSVAEISNSANNLTSATGVQSLNTDQVTNFTVTILIDPASYADLVAAGRIYPFRPGMSASVDILTETVANALSVPIASVTARERDDKKKAGAVKPNTDVNAEDARRDQLVEIVWVATAADTLERREVTTGIQDREVIQVLSGLKLGERIVIGPYSAISRTLKVGEKVYAREDEPDDKKSNAEEEEDTAESSDDD